MRTKLITDAVKEGVGEVSKLKGLYCAWLHPELSHSYFCSNFLHPMVHYPTLQPVLHIAS